ncbi:MAG TPA: PAS-domain containing protein [Rhodocyclaceae bacterium]|nr:PAS-domain containing protein [Rhodocyclaceae bacterium]
MTTNPYLLASLDKIDQGLAVFDSELRMVAWNLPFMRMLDFPPELAYVGSSFENLVRFNVMRGEYGPGDPEVQVMKRVRSVGRHAEFRSERLRPNGQILAIHGEPLPDGGLAVIYTDVTEPRRAARLIEEHKQELEARVLARTAELEAANRQLTQAHDQKVHITAALRRSEERMRLITDTIPAMIGYFDKDSIYRYANRGYAAWFGSSVDQLIGHTVAEAVGLEFFDKVKEHLYHALSGHQVSYEYTLERPDGSTVHARSTLVPEISADGEVQGCFIHSFDITEQKRTQAALIQAQKMEAVGQLTGGIAHDFNNMLTVVMGNVGALMESRGDDPVVREFLEPALLATDRGVELIRRLLSFSRQQPLEPQPVQVSELIRSMTRLLRRSLPETITFETRIDDESIHVMADPHQLESALLNLTLNARDAMPNGGVFRIGYSVVPLESHLQEELQLATSDYVRIQVRDNGIGMNAATLARIFEPFFTTKAFGSGSGLGLSMVYGFVRQSGGGIHVKSEADQGTLIELILPRTDASSLPDPHFMHIGGRNGPARPLVLLVEDDPEVRKVVRLQLTGLGYPVLEAANGDEALTIVQNVEDIAVIVSDVVMPGQVDGRALAQAVQELRPRIFMVLMSGYADGMTSEEDKISGIPMLAKPFTRDELAILLEGRAIATPH